MQGGRVGLACIHVLQNEMLARRHTSLIYYLHLQNDMLAYTPAKARGRNDFKQFSVTETMMTLSQASRLRFTDTFVLFLEREQ